MTGKMSQKKTSSHAPTFSFFWFDSMNSNLHLQYSCIKRLPLRSKYPLVIPATREVSLKDKWTVLLMDWLGWGEEEDIWSWVGRVRGGWAEQFHVLRSAPLMMMMMDVEEQFKTKWKRRWREAISGTTILL